MPTPKRQHAPGVIEQLADAPHRFTFTQLVNLIIRALRRQGMSYTSALRERIAFGNNLSLSFPPSEVRTVEIEPALRNGEQAGRIRITPAFIGLLGAGGTLPLHDTERIQAREAHDGDSSQRALLDVLSSRLVALFYEASSIYRVEHGIDVRGEDTLLPLLSAIGGNGSGDLRRLHAGPVKQQVAACYAGLLRTRPVAACTVEQVLGAYFGVPVRLEQFVGCWDTIPERQRSTLGVTAPVLGASAALGSRLWRHDLRARLHIGPLDEKRLQDFLPGGSARDALMQMVCLFAVPTLRYEVRLVLAPVCVKRLRLTTATTPRKLGWTSFLTATEGVATRPDIRVLLQVPPQGRGDKA